MLTKSIVANEQKQSLDKPQRSVTDSKEMAMAAVRAGVGDIETAYNLAVGGADAAAISAQLLDGGLFAPEKLVPVIVPDAELEDQSLAAVAWEFDDPMMLLADEKFQEALGLFLAEKKGELSVLGDGLEEQYQKDAFTHGVIAKLDSDPIGTIKKVVNWTPDLGAGALGDRDAKAREYIAAAKAANAMGTLTYEPRHDLMADLLDGPTVDEDEDALMDILNSADTDTAKKLIKAFGWQTLYDKIDDGFGEIFKETFPKEQFGQ